MGALDVLNSTEINEVRGPKCRRALGGHGGFITSILGMHHSLLCIFLFELCKVIHIHHCISNTLFCWIEPD